MRRRGLRENGDAEERRAQRSSESDITAAELSQFHRADESVQQKVQQLRVRTRQNEFSFFEEWFGGIVTGYSACQETHIR